MFLLNVLKLAMSVSRVSHLSLKPFCLLFRVAGYINFTCGLLSGLFESWRRLFRKNIWFTTTLVCFLASSITILFLISSATLQLGNYTKIGLGPLLFFLWCSSRSSSFSASLWARLISKSMSYHKMWQCFTGVFPDLMVFFSNIFED